MALPIERIRCSFEKRYLADKMEEVADFNPGANALKLSRSMAPRAYAHLDSVRASLGFDSPVTLFRAEATFDTAHMIDGSTMQFDGAWLDTLPDDCLRAAMAHELGHHLSGHGAGSKKYRRACEITADRFEVIACGLESSLRMSMLGTVGATARIELDTAAYLDDCRAFSEACISKHARAVGHSHPEMRIRAYAKYLFSESDVYRELTGAGAGLNLTEIDDALEALVGAMDDWRAGRVRAPDDDPPLKMAAGQRAPFEPDLIVNARRGFALVTDVVNRSLRPAQSSFHSDADPLEDDRRELEARFVELERRERER